MNIDMGFFLYLFWELSLAAFALGAAVYAAKSRLNESRDYGAEVLLNGLVIKLLLGAAIPQSALFILGGLGRWTLLGAAMALALAAGALWRRLARPPRRACCRAVFTGGLNPSAGLVCAALILLAPVIENSVMPVLEVDSIRHSHFLLKFIDGSAHPFEFFNNYTVLWESSYLPSLALTGSVYYFALTSIQAPILFALASYLLARQLGLGAIAAGLAALTAILSGQFWGSLGTGAATLKNDAIAAAGIMLLLLSAARFIKAGQIELPAAVVLTGGLVFASVKFSGPIIAGALFILLAAFYPKKVLGMNSRTMLFISAAIALFFAASGLYYLRNLWQFGNPVYPFILHLGPVALPGSAAFDPVGTRIVDHLFDPQLWRFFFGIDSSAAERSAFLIKTWFALFLLAPVAILAVKKLRANALAHNAGGGGAIVEPRLLWFLWCAALALWLLFMQTIWSAGIQGDPYFYIRTHNTFRYAIAHIQLLVILAVLCLFSLGRIGRILGCALLAVELLGRVGHLFGLVLWYEFPLYQPELGRLLWFVQSTLFWFCAGAASLVAIAVIARMNPPMVAASALLLLAFFSPCLYERNRLGHGWQLFPMDDIQTGPEPCSASVLTWPAEENALSVWLLPYAFAATGSDMRCRYFGETSVAALTNRRAAGEPLPDYVVATAYYGTLLPDDDFQKIDAGLNSAGYRFLLRTPHAAVFENRLEKGHGRLAAMHGPPGK